MFLLILIFKHFLLIDFFERKGGRGRTIALLLHLLTHSLVDSCMCPDQGGTAVLVNGNGAPTH